MHIAIGHLYPATMSTYGDVGNITALVRRAQWRGIQVTVIPLEVGAEIPEHIDLYFFGGGQDMAQASVGQDLVQRKHRLMADADKGIPMLAICGGYQLFGEAYVPADADPIPGIGILPVRTEASTDRMIGDLVIEHTLGLTPPTVVGFENHSGKTRLTSPDAVPFGHVKHGFGNNGSDKTEGCVHQNIIGCYLHGSLLPKNPHIADWLLEKAVRRQDPAYVLHPLDDTLELQAHAYIVGRYMP